MTVIKAFKLSAKIAEESVISVNVARAMYTSEQIIEALFFSSSAQVNSEMHSFNKRTMDSGRVSMIVYV